MAWLEFGPGIFGTKVNLVFRNIIAYLLMDSHFTVMIKLSRLNWISSRFYFDILSQYGSSYILFLDCEIMYSVEIREKNNPNIINWFVPTFYTVAGKFSSRQRCSLAHPQILCGDSPLLPKIRESWNSSSSKV